MKSFKYATLVTCLLLLQFGADNAEVDASISVFETCYALPYSQALSNPTVWCEAEWLPGGFLADHLKHFFLVYFLFGASGESGVAKIPLTGNVGTHVWYVKCSTNQNVAHARGSVTMFDPDGDPFPGSRDAVSGTVGAYPQCGGGPPPI